MSVWKTLAGSVAAGALAAFIGLQAMPARAQVPESTDPIRLAMNEWTGQHITTTVAGEILKKMGYNVEYVTAGYYPQMISLADGDIDATLEIWSSNIGDSYDKAMATGNVIDLGDLGLKPQEQWVVPDYVVGMCPGLPDYKALYKCYQIFATPDTFPKGRFLDYPADWGTTNAKRIAALKLPFVAVPSGGEGALIAELKSAAARKAPIIAMFWTPHWLWAQMKLQRVYLPPYQKGCYTDPKVGIDPNVTYDCDWAPAHIMKMVNKNMKTKYPAAFKFLQAYRLTNDDQIKMMNEIDAKGRDLMEVVNEWIDSHQSTWQPWVDQAMM